MLYRYRLARGEFPPIANFKQPDPELGDFDCQWVGHQMSIRGSTCRRFWLTNGFTLVKKISNGLNRVTSEGCEMVSTISNAIQS
ncbi:MAG: hypothetical protein Ct9H90mP16_15950 [Candidatus Poseidoniales archaeon]|nr:MAG: hypothetical protein Ct9H90mP16_15950 [Candidatus Poseidoniales archaeon]